MRTIESFMSDYFHAKILDEQRYQADRAAFRRKFFAADCRYDSRAGTLTKLQSERIISIEKGESDSKVISEQDFSFRGNIRKIRLKYHLRPSEEDWLIREVQTGCLVCEGRGDKDCPYCHGAQWVTPSSSQLPD